jgi:hypothetical protein
MVINKDDEEDTFQSRAVVLAALKQILFDDGLFSEIERSGIYRVGCDNRLHQFKLLVEKAPIKEDLIFWVDVREPTNELFKELFDFISTLPESNRVIITTQASNSAMEHLKSNGISFEKITVHKAEEGDDEDMPEEDVLHQEFKLYAWKTEEKGQAKTNPSSMFDPKQLLTCLSECLPQGCGIAQMLDNDDNYICIRIHIASVGILHVLRDDVLGGGFEAMLKKRLENMSSSKRTSSEDISNPIIIKADRTHFAEMYENSILKLFELTKHQRHILRKCFGVDKVHIRAAAGAGKTFIALHRIIRMMRKSRESSILFVVNNKALAIFIGKWLCEHFGGTSSDAEAVLDRLQILCKSNNAKEMDLLKYEIENGKVRLVEVDAVSVKKDFDLMVIDEAHHIYKHQALVAAIEQYSAKEHLVLSDMAQSGDITIEFMEGCLELLLTEVVRSSQRIVFAAANFSIQRGGSNPAATGCLHPFAGTALVVAMYETTSTPSQPEFYDEYATQTAGAVSGIVENYPGLPLHNRVIIIVRDQDFRKQLLKSLKGKLKGISGDSGNGFSLVTAQDAAGTLSSSSSSSKQQLILDSISEVDGLERLFVLCVGLDHCPIKDDPNKAETRSQFYRAITRSQMAVTIINHFVEGGWLQFMTRLETASEDKEFDQKEAMERIDMGSATRVLEEVDDAKKNDQAAASTTPTPAAESPSESSTSDQKPIEAKEEPSLKKEEEVEVEVTPLVKKQQNIFNTAMVKVKAESNQSLAFDPIQGMMSEKEKEVKEMADNKTINEPIKGNEDGNTPLIEAVEAGDVEKVNLLIQYGASVDLPNRNGRTALMWAALNNYIEIAKLLIASNANLEFQNKYGMTALMWAADFNHIEMAKLLIASNAKLDLQDVRGRTALKFARDRGYTEMIQLLEEAGARQ